MESFDRFYTRSSAVTLLAILLTSAVITHDILSIVCIGLCAFIGMSRVLLQCAGVRALATGGNQLALLLAFMLVPIQAMAVAVIFLMQRKQLLPALVPEISLIVLFVPILLTMGFSIAFGIKSTISEREVLA